MAKKKFPFYNSLFIQAVLIVFGFALVSLVSSVYLYQQNMQMIAMKEVENKAIIFLSVMETSVRKFVMERESRSLTTLIEERAKSLENSLNFTIIRIVVMDSEGKILDHTRPEKIGETHTTEDFQKLIITGKPLIKRQIKTLNLEPGQPEIPVIEVNYPVNNRKSGDILAIMKLTLDVGQTLELVHQEYKRFSRKVLLGFALTAVLLVMGTLFFLRRQIISPVLAVAEGSARVALGDLETRLIHGGNNEIGNLIQSFNQMVEGLKQRDHMRHSLEVAMEVQQNLLPKDVPDFKGLDIAGTSIYCDETGGDYYDFLEFDAHEAGKIGIVIGDVSGHGISSALLMATARGFLRQRSALPGTVSQVISDINFQLTRDVAKSGSFMSMFYMTIDKTSRSLKWVRAGHDPAIFYDPDSKTVSELKGAGGMSMGIDESWQYEEDEKQNLENGQLIVLGTDGVWEARNPMGKMFGKEPIYTIIQENADLDAKAIINKIVESLSKFQDTSPAEDDITLVVVKILPEF